MIRTNQLPPLLSNVPVLYAPALSDGRPEIHLRQCADGRMMIGEGDQESLAEDDTQPTPTICWTGPSAICRD